MLDYFNLCIRGGFNNIQSKTNTKKQNKKKSHYFYLLVALPYQLYFYLLDIIGVNQTQLLISCLVLLQLLYTTFVSLCS